jgi:hypothetical protein
MPIPYTKCNLKLVKDIDVRFEIGNLLKKNKGKLLDIGLGNDFF